MTHWVQQCMSRLTGLNSSLHHALFAAPQSSKGFMTSTVATMNSRLPSVGDRVEVSSEEAIYGTVALIWLSQRCMVRLAAVDVDGGCRLIAVLESLTLEQK